MADPISLLREYTVAGKKIVEEEDRIIFGEVSWPKSVKTNCIIDGPGERKEYYTLECLLALLKNARMSHSEQLHTRGDTPVVLQPDREEILAYLKGEIATCASIDESAVLKAASQGQGMLAVDELVESVVKKPKYEDAELQNVQIQSPFPPQASVRRKGRRSLESQNGDNGEKGDQELDDDYQPVPLNPKKIHERRPARKNPFKRPSLKLLKETGQSYLQDDDCLELPRGVTKCRECRSKSISNKKSIVCRFYAFRKLRYTKNGMLTASMFSDPMTDPKTEDMSIWIPSKKSKRGQVLDSNMARFLITQVGDQFCELIHQEKEAEQLKLSETNKPIAWKRLVRGIREMCDVCDTTLFNFHFSCAKCGFSVCLLCYKGRKSGTLKTIKNPGKFYDEYKWLLCTNRLGHEIGTLMLTQAIAGDALEQMAELLHKVRAEQNIPQDCGCEYANKYARVKSGDSYGNGEQQLQISNSPLVPLKNQINDLPKKKPKKRKESSSDDTDDEEVRTTLKKLHSKDKRKLPPDHPVEDFKLDQTKSEILTGNLSSVTTAYAPNPAKELALKHFVRASSTSTTHSIRYGKLLPVVIRDYAESSKSNPTVPHTWLCGGKLLRLFEPGNEGNYKLFQEVWRRGQPVIVSNVSAQLNNDLWSPESFSQDFGEVTNDLINCMNGRRVTNQPMKRFWDGFEYLSKRLKDENGDLMLLKLKDWPAGDDFAEMLPSRFEDLMNALPMKEYTHRSGRLNLAARLPDNFVKPDLGPKMYIAYGSGLHLDKGTTNLHLDISDAVNLMVHASVPLDDTDNSERDTAVLQAITESDCDTLTRNRVTCAKEVPGALWHIYTARDADKIRDLLNKVALERGVRLESHHDPIHDQSWYLDKTLRKRLMEEYDVVGYPIVQCLGDAVFIPAGAPHQVRNLQNCIKIAEDFVSPENVSHCLHLTGEFRNLSETHTNREDKLQIKNIIYHAVKDGLSVLASDLPDIPRILANSSGESTKATPTNSTLSVLKEES